MKFITQFYSSIFSYLSGCLLWLSSKSAKENTYISLQVKASKLPHRNPFPWNPNKNIKKTVGRLNTFQVFSRFLFKHTV